MAVLDNSRHERFAQLIANGLSGAEAYREAGYKVSANVSSVNASRLLKDARVAARIAELQENRAKALDVATAKAAEKLEISRTWVISKLVENANRAMQAEAVKDSQGEATGEYRYDGAVANRALELLGKELGMFVDRKEIGAPGDFERMTDEELAEYVRQEGAAVSREVH